jgi:hypothetical protein
MPKKEDSKKVVPVIKKPNSLLHYTNIPFLESPLRQILYAMQRDRLAKEKAIQEAEKNFYEEAEKNFYEEAEKKFYEEAEKKFDEEAEKKFKEVDEIELRKLDEKLYGKLDEEWPSLDYQYSSPFDDSSKKEIEIFDFITSRESMKNIIAKRIRYSKIRANRELLVFVETPTNTAQVSIDTVIPTIYSPPPSFIMKAFADPPLRSNLNFLNSL